MILSDQEIEAELRKGNIVIDPQPERQQFSPSALDLRLDDEFTEFVPVNDNQPKGVKHDVVIDMATIEIPALRDQYTRKGKVDEEGAYRLARNHFVLAQTLEQVSFPGASRIAARVEGRSTLARMGLVVHFTAPVIHCTFQGKITLEIYNFGPYDVLLRPQMRICQLVLERLGKAPRMVLNSVFQGQRSPTGTPRSRKHVG